MEDIYFSEQHLAVRDMVRSFAREEVARIASGTTSSIQCSSPSARSANSIAP